MNASTVGAHEIRMSSHPIGEKRIDHEEDEHYSEDGLQQQFNGSRCHLPRGRVEARRLSK